MLYEWVFCSHQKLRWITAPLSAEWPRVRQEPECAIGRESTTENADAERHLTVALHLDVSSCAGQLHVTWTAWCR